MRVAYVPIRPDPGGFGHWNVVCAQTSRYDLMARRAYGQLGFLRRGVMGVAAVEAGAEQHRHQHRRHHQTVLEKCELVERD